MLKKIAAVLAFAFAAVMPTAPAAGWDRVCMKLPLWKTWFTAHFHVVHGFPDDYGVLPMSYWEGGKNWALPEALGTRSNRVVVRADGRIESSSVSVNQTKCVDISGLSRGTAFFVYLAPDPGTAAVICETHPSNPNQWYHQQNRPYSTLNYEGWGGIAHPRCKFTHES